MLRTSFLTLFTELVAPLLYKWVPHIYSLHEWVLIFNKRKTTSCFQFMYTNHQPNQPTTPLLLTNYNPSTFSIITYNCLYYNTIESQYGILVFLTHTLIFNLANFHSTSSLIKWYSPMALLRILLMNAYIWKNSGRDFIILVLYVDDILLASSNLSLLQDTKQFFSSQFEMKDMG